MTGLTRTAELSPRVKARIAGFVYLICGVAYSFARSSIYMVFFGFYCLLIGYLIVRSRFLPRILGVFMAIAGLAYQTFLSPPLAHDLFPYVVAPAGALGELSLILWLLFIGVNAERWREQASLA